MIISMKQSKNVITKDMLILDIVEKHPDLGEVLTLDYGFHCIGCMAAGMETLEQGAKVHGMDDKEIDEMVQALNKTVTK